MDNLQENVISTSLFIPFGYLYYLAAVVLSTVSYSVIMNIFVELLGSRFT